MPIANDHVSTTQADSACREAILHALLSRQPDADNFLFLLFAGIAALIRHIVSNGVTIANIRWSLFGLLILFLFCQGYSFYALLSFVFCNVLYPFSCHDYIHFMLVSHLYSSQLISQ